MSTRQTYYRRKPATRATATRRPATKRTAATRRAAQEVEEEPSLLGKGLRYGGAALGTYLGGPVGGALGKKAGGWFSKIIGSGDYAVMGPGLGQTQSMANADQLPSFDYDDRGVVITHREYICDIFSGPLANTFTVNSFAINPGMRTTFPWLSTLVGNSYQQYKFESLVFCFKTFSADALNSTNTALGTVVSCVNYDSTDIPYSSRAQMENTDWAVSTKPSESVLIPVECRPSSVTQNNYYIRSGALPQNADIKTYDLGRLSIATTGFQAANVNCGSLYVTYKIRAMKPIMLQPLSESLSALIDGCAATLSLSLPFGNPDLAAKRFDNYPLTLDSCGMSFPALQIGTCLQVDYKQILNTAGTASAPAIKAVTGSGFAPLNIIADGLTNTFSIPGGTATAGGTAATACFIYNGTSDNTTPRLWIDTGSMTIPGASAHVTVQVTQLNGDLALH